MREDKKWISLQLVGHKKGLKEFERDRREGKSSAGAGCERAGKSDREIADLLGRAWNQKLRVIITYCRKDCGENEGNSGFRISQRRKKCRGKIKFLQRDSPQVIMATGERLDLGEILDIEILG
ncbi:hypothetical protein [Halarsenatibacter silvermanii]|uniref:Uncharacterized protein n=1 Tax=Halarsenatibacter silvermanii TaxID=321763 RepID=A0A1G9H4E9_9FIRM|nr:hypothetical protein [Halarsenatibacter silvermanii]SDL07749.1 hypothetical protein SAMN04488692_10196 [Halarsenatibacter silvermanii]